MTRLALGNEVDLDAMYAWPDKGGAVVRGNMVASADGAAALHGVTAGLSGAADKRIFAVLRGLADVVLAGIGTVRAEDYGPARPAPQRRRRRLESGLAEVPPIAVVTSRLDLDPAARLFDPAAPRPILLHADAAPADRRAELRGVAELVACGGERVELAAALDALADRGLRRVLCEGGPTLLSGILAAGRLDELCLTLSPVLHGTGGPRILGGQALPATVALSPLHVLADEGFLFVRYAVDRS